MIDNEAIKVKFNLKSILNTIRFKREFSIKNPDYFYPDGFTCFCGPQGSGKTLSAVLYTIKLLNKYPKAKLVTNINIAGYMPVLFREYLEENNDRYLYYKDHLELGDKALEVMQKEYYDLNRVFPFMDNDDFTKYRNGQFGVIYLVDEIHLYLNSLESKNINFNTMSTICQQRKQRLHIIGTAQVFGRLAKQLREAFNSIILCKNYFAILQMNKVIDRDSIDDENTSGLELTGAVKSKEFWFHDPKFYKMYDTYSIIERGKFKAGDTLNQEV